MPGSLERCVDVQIREDNRMLVWASFACAALIAGIVCVAAWGIANEKKQQQQWAVFAQEHQCVMIERVQPASGNGVFTGVSAGGKIVFGSVSNVSPAKTAFKCNDGITYWR